MSTIVGNSMIEKPLCLLHLREAPLDAAFNKEREDQTQDFTMMPMVDATA